MATNILTKIFGSRNDRLLKQYRTIVKEINKLEADVAKLSDEQLRAKTDAFRARVAQGESLDNILPEAFAVVREAARLGYSHALQIDADGQHAVNDIQRFQHLVGQAQAAGAQQAQPTQQVAAGRRQRAANTPSME